MQRPAPKANRSLANDAHRRAYETWKSIRPTSTHGAATRMTRDQTHERR